MKELNSLANIAAMKQLKRELLKSTKSQFMKDSNSLANFAAVDVGKSF